MSSRQRKTEDQISRRTLLKGMGFGPLLLRASPLMGLGSVFDLGGRLSPPEMHLQLAESRLRPTYPSRSPLDDVLRRVAPGSDEFTSEKSAFEIEAVLRRVSQDLRDNPLHLMILGDIADPAIVSTPLVPVREELLRNDGGLRVVRRFFAGKSEGSELFQKDFQAYFGADPRVETAEFQVIGIEQLSQEPQRLSAEIRYGFVLGGSNHREERIGHWRTEWVRNEHGEWRATRWVAEEESVAQVRGSAFLDVTEAAVGECPSYKAQMLHGADYWRTVLDGACGVDVYGNNGVALGDYDNDGFDDLYVSQPAGLPNRLYRNKGDGTFEDVTEKAGVGVLDSTSCALFADFDNRGYQDLLIVCANGPLLFINQGNGQFIQKAGAFKFAANPQGSFTHAALADYDRDGRLDIYFCTYSYYVGLDQYHYPVPYYDARNGPANFLFHNEGGHSFVDKTSAAGLSAENDRYSFACAWNDFDGNGFPDLYVANDFGRGNLYRNNGDGSFTAISDAAHINDPGAGMSAAWSDFDNDGNPDVYVANMWSAAGQRISKMSNFHSGSSETIRAHYRRHARGNAMYRNSGKGIFENDTDKSGTEMGRWAWCSDFVDLDQDGYSDLYVANGYISAPNRDDLGSFFWRQVVAKSPDDATPSLAYEHGWNALNELVRSDTSWSGYERNVLFANNQNGTFSEASGALGLDYSEDSRSFALADLDHDGRLEIVLKNRNAPQLRILRNGMAGIGNSITFRLRGRVSNRDAIGAAITVETNKTRQTITLQAGSGFLAQHSKDVHFGVGPEKDTIAATIRWPTGTTQRFDRLPIGHRIEIEEGSPTFTAKVFSPSSPSYSKGETPATKEELPVRVETWLLEPLAAPQFSLTDGAGRRVSLKDLEGSFVLLFFWARIVPESAAQLQALGKRQAALSTAGIKVVAICVDGFWGNEDGKSPDASSDPNPALQGSFSFPLTSATQEVLGLYNIVYRHLFDRRRDLGVPTSFLINATGMIVKVYQGLIDPRKVETDVRAVPETAEERMQRALPFPGLLCQSSFQRNDFTYGVAFFQRGYLDQAADSFQQVIAAKPNDPEGYYNLGTLNLRRNNFPEAKRYLEQTLKLKPDYPEAWNNLGMIAAQQGNADDAIRNFEKSLVQRPGYAIALLNLGNVYRRKGLFDKALDVLNQARTLQPDDPEIHYALGMLFAQQNQSDRAVDSLRKAIELRPDYPEAMNNLGVLFVRAKDYSKAEQQFETCIRIVPGFDQSYLNLARLYAVQGDKDKARQVLLELQSKQPDNQNARRALEMLESVR